MRVAGRTDQKVGVTRHGIEPRPPTERAIPPRETGRGGTAEAMGPKNASPFRVGAKAPDAGAPAPVGRRMNAGEKPIDHRLRGIFENEDGATRAGQFVQ